MLVHRAGKGVRARGGGGQEQGRDEALLRKASHDCRRVYPPQSDKRPANAVLGGAPQDM